jgi:hypothetical protein
VDRDPCLQDAVLRNSLPSQIFKDYNNTLRISTPIIAGQNVTTTTFEDSKSEAHEGVMRGYHRVVAASEAVVEAGRRPAGWTAFEMRGDHDPFQGTTSLEVTAVLAVQSEACIGSERSVEAEYEPAVQGSPVAEAQQVQQHDHGEEGKVLDDAGGEEGCVTRGPHVIASRELLWELLNERYE